MAPKSPKDLRTLRQLELAGYPALFTMIGVLIWSVVSKTYLVVPIALFPTALAIANIVIARRKRRRLNSRDVDGLVAPGRDTGLRVGRMNHSPRDERTVLKSGFLLLATSLALLILAAFTDQAAMFKPAAFFATFALAWTVVGWFFQRKRRD